MTEQELVRSYRELNPKSRVISILKYFRVGPTVKQKRCILCNELGPSWCGKFPKTKLAAEWELQHTNRHASSNAHSDVVLSAA